MDLTIHIFQPNDISYKYSIMVFNRLLHRYLKLEDEYEISYPTEVITRDMRNLKMDSLYKTTGNQLNNIEAQSKSVGINEMKRFADYRIFAEYFYNMPVTTIIIITVDPKNSIKEYHISETDLIRPIYKYLTKNEIKKKYKNIVYKTEHDIKLSESEILDIGFLPFFAPAECAKKITEKMCKIIKRNKNIRYELKRDITFVLQIMIFKYFEDYEKRSELLGELNMMQFKSDLEIIAYELYGEKLEEKKEQLEQKEKQLKQNQEQLKESEKQIKQTKKILMEIKEKNNLDKDTLAKIDKILNYWFTTLICLPVNLEYKLEICLKVNPTINAEIIVPTFTAPKIFV